MSILSKYDNTNNIFSDNDDISSQKYLIINNPDVISFYKSNKNINFEQSQILLMNILKMIHNSSNSSNSSKIHNYSSAYLHLLKYVIPNIYSDVDVDETKKNDVELNEELEHILNKLNPESKIIKNTDTTICGEYTIIRNNNNNNSNKNIIIENKIDKENINPMVVDFFKNSCKSQKSNGILMSQYSGIISKKDFEIDIIGNNVIVYMHTVYLDENKINLVLNIIDKLSDKLIQLNTNNTITEDVLNEIKIEYQEFNNSKLELQSFIKNTNSIIANKLENMKLCNTGEYLSSKYTLVDKPKSYTCDICNLYKSNTLKGIAAHKRGCKKKFGQ